ncbi:MAG: Manganese transport system membrane protein MntC [Chlamydiales bacterium]|nr:Manganese transport system membrane protein MntC [Chlamydiales bacterium]
MNFWECFTDPVVRAPMIGSMLMCLAAALVGVVVFVRKRSLLGEALSHATYPGVTGAILFAGIFSLDESLPVLILLGAALLAFVGFFCIDFLERKLKITDDAALCLVLALFFGFGVTIASYVQNIYSPFYRQIQGYLYGQAATMTDLHILIYGVLTLLVISVIFLFYKEILALAFDRPFCQASGMAVQLVRALFTCLIVGAVVIGIRSVGVILMSAMLIAPATAARQFTNRLSRMFLLSALFGLFSGCVGTYLSILFPGIPTGPVIVLVAGTIALYALLFAPERGLLMRYWRIARFRSLRMRENLLKLMWHLSNKGETSLSFHTVAQGHGLSKIRLVLLLFQLRLAGWLKKVDAQYQLTTPGIKRGGRIVRLHRLWEVYLVNALGLGVERVHKSAEEMEHILTPELERQLTQLLDDPKKDPHEQPIPSQEEVMSHG